MSDAPPALAGRSGRVRAPGRAGPPNSAIRLAAGLVALEAVGLVVLAVAEIVSSTADRPSIGVTNGRVLPSLRRRARLLRARPAPAAAAGPAGPSCWLS